MYTISCPECGSTVNVTVKSTLTASKNGATSVSNAGPLNRKAMRRVFEFMKRTGEGKFPSRELHERYLTEAPAFGDPALTIAAFVRAVKSNGGSGFRDGQRRYLILPALTEEDVPGKPALREQIKQERLDHPALHGGGTPLAVQHLINKPAVLPDPPAAPPAEPEKDERPFYELLGFKTDPLADPRPFG